MKWWENRRRAIHLSLTWTVKCLTKWCRNLLTRRRLLQFPRRLRMVHLLARTVASSSQDIVITREGTRKHMKSRRLRMSAICVRRSLGGRTRFNDTGKTKPVPNLKERTYGLYCHPTTVLSNGNHEYDIQHTDFSPYLILFMHRYEVYPFVYICQSPSLPNLHFSNQAIKSITSLND